MFLWMWLSPWEPGAVLLAAQPKVPMDGGRRGSGGQSGVDPRPLLGESHCERPQTSSVAG
jgi:hypothetical protein